ncbi:MAG: RNA polymerase ECF-type sigma factor, partial [uncultured Rubrobacteraceae bacterium]
SSPSPCRPSRAGSSAPATCWPGGWRRRGSGH